MDINAALDEIVADAKARPALTVGDKFKEAYSPGFLRRCWESHTPGAVKRAAGARIKEIPRNQSLQRFEALSAANLQYALSTTKALAARVAAEHGEDVVQAAIDAAEEACKLSNLALVHSAAFRSSAHAEPGGTEAIMADKKLVAPYYRPTDLGTMELEDNAMVFCNAVHQDAPLRSDINYFLVKKLPPQLIKRCAATLATGEGVTSPDIIVGGNHLEAAWKLRTINELLDYHVTRAQPEQFAEIARKYACSEIEIIAPREISLEGQLFIENGQAQQIGSARTPRKAPPRPKGIAPGDSDLDRQPRIQGLNE